MKRQAMLRALLLISALLATGAAAAQDLLEPEKAFRFSARMLEPGTVEVRYQIARGYYLYRDRFRFAVEPMDAKLGTAEFPKGDIHSDQFFGKVETYRKEVRIRLPIDSPADSVKLKVTSQGCADVGVCYVPNEQVAELRLASASTGATSLPGFLKSTPESNGLTGSAVRGDSGTRADLSRSDLDVAAMFESGSIWLVLASFFGFGLLLAFTPCMLPMIPILSGIIVGEGREAGKQRALVLSLAYVFGMAVSYAIAGVLAGFSGSLLAAALQNPWVLSVFALVFVWLALSMFGFHDIQLPSFLHHRLASAQHRLSGGRVASVALMGVFSAVIVSPCVAAPLAGALLYIGQTRDVALGGSALFVMALGMGLPLVVVGVSEGAFLPKSGPWMKSVKMFFGVLLLGVAIWIISPVIPVAAQMLAWAALLIGSAVFLRALDRLSHDASGVARLGKAFGVLLLLAGASLVIGAAAGSRDPLRPLAGVFGSAADHAAPTPFERIKTVAELDQRIKAAGRPAMLDFYADWCVSCKEMERFTFSDPEVQAKLQDLLLLQADVTANDREDQALLRRFRLFGPPGIIFFDRQGREITDLRVIGYQSAGRFVKALDLATNP